MSKKKHKKRNKPYTGDDAANKQPVVHRVTAKVRSPLGQWWYDHKRPVKIFGAIGGSVLLVGYLLFELFNIIF